MLDQQPQPDVGARQRRDRHGAGRHQRRGHAAADLSGRLPPWPRLRAGAAIRVREGAEGRGCRLDGSAAAHLRDRACAGGCRCRLACGAGFDLYTRRGGGEHGEQFAGRGGRIRGHVDGVLLVGPAIPGMAFPALWECKTMNAKSWRETSSKGVAASKPIYAQIAVYQAYMDAAVPGGGQSGAVHRHQQGHGGAAPRAGAVQRRAGAAVMDRGVRILAATDAGELLPRIAAQADHFECRFCPGPSAAGLCLHEHMGRLQRRGLAGG